MKRILLFLSIIILALASPVCAHSGDTDEDGGHYDSSTGGYHYHHGYPAHYHYDMDGDGKADCPYEFKDKTSHNSGGSSTGSYSNNSIYSYYLDGYNNGHEKGYLEGYSKGEYSGYEAGKKEATEILEAEKQEIIESNLEKGFYACAGTCAATAAIAGLSTKKRKREDAQTIDETREELSSVMNSLRSANIEIGDLKREASDTKNNFETEKKKLSDTKKEAERLTQENQRLSDLIDSNIGASLYQKLVDTYGENYISVLAKAPDGDWLDEHQMPHSKLAKGFRSSDNYVFYLGGSTDRPTKRYHTKFCHHANRNVSVNAYQISRNGTYSRCLRCMPQIPDVSWVDRYKVYREILKDIKPIEEESMPDPASDYEPSPAAPPSPPV